MGKQAEHLTGTFKLIDGREVFGDLYLWGEDSKITLFDDAKFPNAPEDYTYITGELHDGRLVTLLQCTLENIKSRRTPSDRRKYTATVFPHFISLGHGHILSSEPCISQMAFAMKDAPAVFYDFDAFSTVLHPQPFIPLLEKDKARMRRIEMGDNPIICYFTGKFDIAVVETEIGEVKAHHKPTETIGGPRGVRIDNEVMITLTPSEPLTFRETINRLSILLRFFELVLGREQPLNHLSVELCGQKKEIPSIELYRSFAPNPYGVGNSEESLSPSPRDALVSTIDSAEQYSTVLRNYIALDRERHDSRVRLQSAMNTGRRYTIDRIIAAANIFDILPASVYPAKVTISEELANAKSEARKLFKALPDSLERSIILSAIGRIGKLSLKHKIRHRITSTELDKHFPQLFEVIEEAVNCRNHYVHGTVGQVDYSSNPDLICFFTDALEFSFAASDLIDCGWDFSNWKKGLPGYSHPFGVFVANYQHGFKYFKEMIRSDI